MIKRHVGLVPLIDSSPPIRLATVPVIPLACTFRSLFCSYVASKDALHRQPDLSESPHSCARAGLARALCSSDANTVPATTSLCLDGVIPADGNDTYRERRPGVVRDLGH
jgi:hypothetical protein